MTTRTIKVDYLARVEGEGALDVRLRGDQVEAVRLHIFEPPRFFEALLRGRRAEEAVDITARICGICPVAYQMSACHALEDAAGVVVAEPHRSLRRLLYCGEWIESHTLHISMLHGPDFYGVASVVELAKREPAVVERALRLKKAGNALVEVLGGRAIHPINVRLGGWYRLPPRRDLLALRDELTWARDAAVELAEWVAGFDFPDHEVDLPLVALHHPDEYALNEGRICSTAGHDLSAADFAQHCVEEQVAHSTALQARLDGERYLVGPLARYSLNHAQLPALAQAVARACGLGPVCRNPFRSIIVRAVEVVFACDEALGIIANYEPQREQAPALAVSCAGGRGYAVTEAPRGLLLHRYHIDDQGLIADAQLVPPTAQNQAAIEADLKQVVAKHHRDDDDQLRARCERVIRNYDPCISCATHFLNLRVERR
ncbi:MAG: Ni/Fe hydrogenase subunit alpha [Planctomycetota bacterium]|jgi:coenzyme F420-reducing hydrogenase alpha subunit